MVAASIENEFKKKVCEQVQLLPEGTDRYRVFTPFDYGDGDQLSPVLKRAGGRWLLTDEGSTFMRLSYRLSEDIFKGTRGKIVENALAAFGVENREGELCLAVPDEAYGDALFSFIQAVLRISDVQYWTRKIVRDTFIDDLRAAVKTAAPNAEFEWHDPESDPKGVYPVDCLIPGTARPLFLFGIQNDAKCATATIVIQHYQKAGIDFDSLAVFEEQEAIGRKPLARLSDVVGKQFSSLSANKKQLANYLADHAASV